jgi:hypothetical protein
VTDKEKRIFWELCVIYVIYASVVLGAKMDFLGTVPQWLTAVVAVGALGVALRSIESQREIARKRAAIDFFTRTETDKHTLDQYKAFKNACDKLKEHLEGKRPLEDFSKTDEYFQIRDYLNVHELMGVGINREVFDDWVCEDFWSGELYRACRDTGPLIEWIQRQPGEAETYIELLEVNQRWRERDSIDRAAHQ